MSVVDFDFVAMYPSIRKRTARGHREELPEGVDRRQQAVCVWSGFPSPSFTGRQIDWLRTARSIVFSLRCRPLAACLFFAVGVLSLLLDGQ